MRHDSAHQMGRFRVCCLRDIRHPWRWFRDKCYRRNVWSQGIVTTVQHQRYKALVFSVVRVVVQFAVKIPTCSHQLCGNQLQHHNHGDEHSELTELTDAGHCWNLWQKHRLLT